MTDWRPDLRPWEEVDSARARIALAVLPIACELVAAGKITKPEKGGPFWRAACWSLSVADAWLGAWAKSTGERPDDDEGPHDEPTF